MVAKYDYDLRQLSPNPDAEQVELSFRQGDVITVFGPMDEDGFYIGELNGVRGLVPSNFLQAVPANNTEAGPLTANHVSHPVPNSGGEGVMAGPTGAYGPPAAEAQARPKGVVFQDPAIHKPAPVRQISQTSVGKVSNSMGSVAAGLQANAAKPRGAGATAGTVNKAGVKKGDVGKAVAPNATRKASQAVKKDAAKVSLPTRGPICPLQKK